MIQWMNINDGRSKWQNCDLRHRFEGRSGWTVKTEMGGIGEEVQEGGDIFIHRADSLCCTIEANTTL